MNDIETTLAPWLSVDDAQGAVDFYSAAFGTTEAYRLDDDGRLAVARLVLGAAELWVQEDSEATHERREHEPIRLILSVDDPDGVCGRAVAAGATVVAPVSEDHGWRTGRIVDPFGHAWEISRQLDDV